MAMLFASIFAAFVDPDAGILPKSSSPSSIPTSDSIRPPKKSPASAVFDGVSAAAFDIDPLTGFLPNPQPLSRLDIASWAALELLWDQSAGVKLTEEQQSEGDREKARVWRKSVEATDPPSTSLLDSKALLRRAHVLLSYIIHRYMHSDTSTVAIPVVPPALSEAWIEVSVKLGIPPITTYSDLVMWNWTLINPVGDIVPSNMRTVNNFTGTRDEEWFYLVSAFIELQGAPALSTMAACLQNISSDPCTSAIGRHLESLTSVIKSLTLTMDSMFNECSTYVFYNDIRPWFNSGTWQHFDGRLLSYGGANAGQSSFIHALDIFLGVEHQSSSVNEDGQAETFLQAMTRYMPGPHRDFLHHLAAISPTLREYVLAADDAELRRKFDGAIDALKGLRESHMRVVHSYIVKEAKLAAKRKEAAVEVNEDEIKGTGGSDLVGFLKETRVSTIAAKLD